LVWATVIIVSLLAAAIWIWFLQRYYAKATLDTALVRTGLGGQKVVRDGGCLSLPILHQLQKVSMQTVPLKAARTGQDAALTKDQIRADVEMSFELRVSPTPEGIATAAQALGQRVARGGDAVQASLEGALIDAILAAAATRSLDEIHFDRTGFATEVSDSIEEQAARIGLMVVSGSLITIDQSDLTQMNENNVFNAKGMRRLAELISEERKARVLVETQSEIAVQKHRLTQHQSQLDLKRAEREAEINQSEELDRLEANAQSRAEQARAEAALSTQNDKIEKDRLAKTAQVENDEMLRRTEMAALLKLEQEKIDNDIRLSKKRAEESAAKAAEEEARVQVILAAERAQAEKDRAVEAREREIAKLRKDKEIELETAQVKSDVETLLEKARAEAAVKTTQADAEKARMEAEAAGRSALNAAENTLSDALIRMRLEERKLDRMPEIMTQMMKPVEKIDSIRINHIGGIGGTNAAGEGADGAFGSAMDQILGMAVRLPAMKQMGEEIGLDFDANLAGRTADYANRIKSKGTPDKKD